MEKKYKLRRTIEGIPKGTIGERKHNNEKRYDYISFHNDYYEFNIEIYKTCDPSAAYPDLIEEVE